MFQIEEYEIINVKCGLEPVDNVVFVTFNIEIEYVIMELANP